MSTWDIVDVVGLNNDVVATKQTQKPVALRALITSAAKIAFAITLAVGSTSNIMTQRSEGASTIGSRITFTGSPQFVQRQTPVLRHRMASETDTQFGQSTVKLARLFATYFVPAEAEEAFEDDYSFS